MDVIELFLDPIPLVSALVDGDAEGGMNEEEGPNRSALPSSISWSFTSEKGYKVYNHKHSLSASSLKENRLSLHLHFRI